MTFVAACLVGRAVPEDVDDYIDTWHEEQPTCLLREYLGLSETEYAAFVHDATVIRRVVLARRLQALRGGTKRERYQLLHRTARKRMDRGDVEEAVAKWMGRDGPGWLRPVMSGFPVPVWRVFVCPMPEARLP